MTHTDPEPPSAISPGTELSAPSDAFVPTDTATPHLGFIDGIRALAALFVLVCHAFYEPANGYYAGKVMNHLGLNYGHLSVDVFIVLSGFCLMLPVARRGDRLGPVSVFFRRRARRILPPYYAALLLSALFILTAAHRPTSTVWDNCLPLTWPQFLAHAALIQNLPLSLPGGTIDYPLWSIAAECQIYLFMPLVAVALPRLGVWKTAGAALCFGFLLHVGFAGRLDSATPWYLGLFVLGAIAARECIRQGANPQPVWRWVSYLLWGSIGFIVLAKGKDFFLTHTCYIDTLAGLAAAFLIAATYQDAAAQKYRLTRLLSWKPLVKIGLFSYSLYLVHAPLLHGCDLLWTFWLHPKPVVMFLLLLASTPCIVGAAYLFHLAFEKPFFNKARPAVSPPKGAARENMAV